MFRSNTDTLLPNAFDTDNTIVYMLKIHKLIDTGMNVIADRSLCRIYAL